MDILITGRNIEIDEDIKRYVHRKIGKVYRIYKRIYKCEVVLEKEKDRYNSEVILHLKNNQLVSKESSLDLYASVEMSSQNILKQVRRLSGKLKAKRRKAVIQGILAPRSVFASKKNVIEDEDRDMAGEIVDVEAYAPKPMLPEEARSELDSAGLDFIMFRNANTDRSNLIYRRKDGSFGLIRPRF